MHFFLKQRPNQIVTPLLSEPAEKGYFNAECNEEGKPDGKKCILELVLYKYSLVPRI